MASDLERGLEAYESGDYETALTILKPLAEQGNAEAQYNLVILYYEGIGVTQDAEKAIKWVRRAADQDHPVALMAMSFFSLHNTNQAQGRQEMVQWLRRAAEQGLAEAQFGYGVLYHLGQVVPQDNPKAYQWIYLAQINGYNETEELRDILENLMTAADISKAKNMARTCLESAYKDC